MLLAWAPGPMEMMIFGVICLLLFGSRLPSTMRSLGQSVTQFKKGMTETDEETPDPKLPPKNGDAT